jgi:hypothetical protein
MRKMIANAMLCLFLLLSVATARCESLCAMSAMPATAMAMTQDDAMTMDSDMGHCHGMQAMQNGLPNADSGCGQMNCRHQALPASSDVRVVADTTASLAVVTLPIVEHAVMSSRRVDDAVDPPRSVPLTPLEQSSMLRV